MCAKSKIPAKFLYPFLDAIRKNLPPEISNNDSEVYEILAEIEGHVMDLIFDMTETGNITDEIIQNAIKQMGDPKSIAFEYHDLYLEKQKKKPISPTTYMIPMDQPNDLNDNVNINTVIEPKSASQDNISVNSIRPIDVDKIVSPMNISENPTQIQQNSNINENILMQPVPYKPEKLPKGKNPAGNVLNDKTPTTTEMKIKGTFLAIEAILGLIYFLIGFGGDDNVNFWYLPIGSLILLDSLIFAIQMARKLPKGKNSSPINILELLIEVAVIVLIMFSNLFNSTVVFEIISFTIVLIIMGLRMLVIIIVGLRT